MTTLSQAVRRAILTRQLRAGHARHDNFPPILPAPKIPAVLVHNGLNKNDLHDPTVPVLVQVIVPMGWGVGDYVNLYWNDVAVATQVISADDRELAQTNVRVLPAHIPEGVTRVHYHHFGLVGEGETASIEHAPFLVKRTVPGNPDPNPNTPYINENLSPLTGIPESLPATGGPLTLGIARYENIAADDVITIYWSGVPVTRTVSQEEATGSGALSVVISAEIIRNNPGLNLAVTYDIRDTVKNWSLFSETQRTDVESAAALHVPTVRDADDFDVLDVDELAGGDVAIQIPVNGNLDIPSTGTLTWTGQPVLGPRLTYTLPFSITQASTRLTLWVPHIQAAALVGSTATVYYDGVRSATPGRSARASVSLVGQPVELAEPTLTGVSGGTYNPDLITGTHQEVLVPAYSFMAVDQSVTLIWEGTTASGGSVYQTQTVPIQQPAQVGRPVSFLIEKIYATTLAGGSLRVSYTVVAQGQEYRSQVLELTVSGQVNTLPAPETIPVFANGNVDPGQVGATLQVVVKANGLLLPGDQVTVHWHGNPDASTNPTNSFPATGDLSVIIAKDPFVLGNAGGLVDVWYDVRRNGVPFGSSRVLTLNIGDAGAQPWPAPVVTDATGSVANPLNPIRPSTGNTENTATVVLSDPRLALGDVVATVWRYPDGTNPSIPYGLVTTAGQVQMAVPREVLAASVGRTIEVVCVVFRANAPVGTSQTLNLVVSSIPQSALPTPAITEAQGNELDVSRLTANATATVAAWPLIATAQFYWLEARGTLANNSPTVIPVASNVQVSNLNGV
ncbi:hypothetical protein, partial [Pseudomonas sp. RIT-To-2]|uniref:hypothetical protein n=1 Tax=Pseudomonas sp. RIT-To-2 TaxID=3462541 RepID=UPI00241351A9